MNPFPPSFELVGTVVSVEVREPSTECPFPAARVLIQYGEDRAWNNQAAANFVNQLFVRMPYNTHKNFTDKLVEGATVQIKGRMQGVDKMTNGYSYMKTELVAERIAFAQAVSA